MSEQASVYDPASFRRVFVEEAAELKRVVEALQTADAIGVDLEMVQRIDRRPGGLQEWIQVLALIQIASDDLSAVVDPVRCKDLSPLGPLMAGPTRKVFLGGGQDDALLRGAGIPARTIVDVGEIALALFGRRQDGMAALASRIFGISLDKTVRRTDWLLRPLNPVLLSYAHRDAELTLLIYRWFQEHYPEAVHLHERTELEPRLPDGAAPWLRDVAARASSDALAVLMEQGLDPQRDSDRLAADVRAMLLQARAPRQLNRLIRIAGDLGFEALLPDILPFAQSRSSLLRAAAARAIGQLADAETGEPILQQLKQDQIEDVKRAAESGLRELRAPKAVAIQEEEQADSSSLSEGAQLALQQLLQQLEGDSR